jgi:hypothetical protein
MANSLPVDDTQDVYSPDGVAVKRHAIDPKWLGLLAEAEDEIRQVVKKPRATVSQTGFTVMRESGDYVTSENAWTFNDKLNPLALAALMPGFR